jgi:hypothetical protein
VFKELQCFTKESPEQTNSRKMGLHMFVKNYKPL